ncbi:MAG: DUF4333 domain-containing protein [Mycobacterium sp.]|uniref:DUF4333 domain-containing protein n=1 Tax=Mycobacterium sp. TaxID=1785 RepID=UPI003BB67B12
MNRPPGPGSGQDPDVPWYLRRPASDDDTAARPLPAPQRPAPPRRYPPPSPPRDVNQSPPAYRPPLRPPVTPWYQRPDHPVPPTPAATPPARPQLNRWLLIGAGTVAVLIAAAVILVGVTRLGATGGKVLDVAKVQAGVLQTLSDPAGGYGANTVTDVSCNNGHNPSANKGTTFTCDATVNGAQRHVSVVVSDDNGTYEIDAPR